MAAVCYVSLDPVRTRLARAEDWPWSSVRAHLAGADDALVAVRPAPERQPDLAAMLADAAEAGFAALRRSEGSGRPVGTADFRRRSRAPARPPHRRPRPRTQAGANRCRPAQVDAIGIVSTYSPRSAAERPLGISPQSGSRPHGQSGWQSSKDSLLTESPSQLGQIRSFLQQGPDANPSCGRIGGTPGTARRAAGPHLRQRAVD
jgi:putative transposase